MVAKDAKWFGFVLGHASSTAFVDFTNAGSTGTKMPRTSWAEMARYPVVVPSDAVAEVYNECVQRVVERLMVSIYESRLLAAVRDTLLPNSFQVNYVLRMQKGSLNTPTE
jgi:type I restriction enzyme S subunit